MIKIAPREIRAAQRVTAERPELAIRRAVAAKARARTRIDGRKWLNPDAFISSMVLAGIPGKPSTQTGFGALTYTTSPPPVSSASASAATAPLA